MHLSNSVDNLLIVIFAVHHVLLLKCAKVTHDFTLHTLQWKTGREEQDNTDEEALFIINIETHQTLTIDYIATVVNAQFPTPQESHCYK